MGGMPIDDLLMGGGGDAVTMLAPMEPEQEVFAPAVQTEETFDHQRLIENINNPNIANDLDADELSKIGQKVHREYQLDLGTRSEWEERMRVALDLAMQYAKTKTFPWVGASNVIFPLMTSAAVQFAARAYPAVIQNRSVVKGVVIGPDNGIPAVDQMGMPVMQQGPQGPMPQWMVPPGAKQDRAQRVGDHMSWQLLEEMDAWEEETDKLLHILPIVGCVFRKSLYHPGMGCNSSLLVLAQNLVINYTAKSMERAPRLTECLQFYPYEIEEMVRAGLFRDENYDVSGNADGDDDAPREFLEQHRWLDMDDDGYPEPYIVTVHKPSMKVARITARYDAEGVQVNTQTGQVLQIDPVHYYTKYDFLPNPDGGIYGVGFGQLLGPINESVNTTLNQLFDAGALQNTGGGFVGKGLSMHSGSLKFRLGEWKQVNVPGATLKDAIVPFNHPGPSPVLFQLLGLLVDAGRDIASVKDVLTGDTTAATMQPTTLMALIQQGLTVFTAIVKRVHRSLGREYDKIYRLNRIYLDNQARYKVGDEWKVVTREDYARGAGVEPVSDPSMVTDMQRMAKAQFLMTYQNDPLCDGVEIRKRIMKAAQIDDVDKIVHGQMPPNPEILKETAELEHKQKEFELETHRAEIEGQAKRVGMIKDLSQAVKSLAEADMIKAEIPMLWIPHEIEIIRTMMESLREPAEGARSPMEKMKQLAPPPPQDMPQPPGGDDPLMLADYGVPPPM